MCMCRSCSLFLKWPSFRSSSVVLSLFFQEETGRKVAGATDRRLLNPESGFQAFVQKRSQLLTWLLGLGRAFGRPQRLTTKSSL